MPAANLPTENMSVYDFCSKARDLYDSPEPANFVRFVLNGVHEGMQAVVDPILNAIKDEEQIRVFRDYDSLLGIDTDIQVTSPLTVYPVARTEDVLSKNIHIHYNFKNSEVSFASLNIDQPRLRVIS